MKTTPSIQSISEALGLSKATVSKALNGYPQIKEETRLRVQEYAQKVGYRLPGTPKGGQEEGRRIGILIKDIEGDISNVSDRYEIMMAFKQYAEGLKMEVVLLDTTTQGQQKVSYDQLMREKQLAGALVMGLRMDDPYYGQIQETKIPTVLWDIGFDNPRVGCVSYDSVRGAELACDHLIALGHKQLGYLSGHKSAQVSYTRLSGYMLAMSKAGLPHNPLHVYYGDYTDRSGEAAADYYAHTDVTAVFCASDKMAIGLIRRLQALGKRVPEDVAVVGFDNDMYARLSSPTITTVNQDMTQLGRTACALLKCIFDGVPIGNAVLRPTLVIRESCGAGRKAGKEADC